MSAWMKPMLGYLVVIVALYIILFRPHDEAARQWAVGAIAFILGYYFRGSEPDVPR